MPVNPNSLKNLKPMKKGEPARPGAGRPKTTYITAMRNALNAQVTQKIADDVVKIWIERIKRNDKHSVEYLKLFVEKCVVTPKEQMLQLDIAGKDAEGVAEAIKVAIENGQLSGTECAQLASLIKAIGETTDFKFGRVLLDAIKEHKSL